MEYQVIVYEVPITNIKNYPIDNLTNTKEINKFISKFYKNVQIINQKNLRFNIECPIMKILNSNQTEFEIILSLMYYHQDQGVLDKLVNEVYCKYIDDSFSYLPQLM